MTAPNLVTVADVKVGGAPLTQEQRNALRTVRVEISLWVPGRGTVRFVDHDFALVDSGRFAVGKELEVSVPSGGSMKPVFSGEITDVSVEPGPLGRHELVVGALDRSHRLAIATTIKTYTNQTWAGIVQGVANEVGLTPKVSIPGGASLPYVLQTTSHYAFLWEIALRTNCEWWVEGKELHFRRRATSSGPTVSYGAGLSTFRVRYSGATKVNKVTVQGWNAGTQSPVKGDDSGGPTQAAIPGIGSNAGIATEGRSKAVAAWGKGVVTGRYAVADATEAAVVADAIAARVDAAEVLARGSCELNPSIVVGSPVTVENMGAKVSGDYLVTSVEHLIGPEIVETRFTAGNKAPVDLADLVGGGRQSATPGWGALGLVVGVVTNVKDDPDKAGRVKVKFPTLSGTDESAWARVASPGAGKERGLHLTPEVKDEVLVGFEHGDLRYPVVLGGLWSKGSGPPVGTAADPVASRMVKSRLGHTLELSDGDGDDKKHIELALADGKNKLRLGADKTDIEVASGKPFTIKAGNATIAVDGQGNISIKGGKVTIEAQQDLALKGMNVKIEGQMNVEVKAGMELKTSGGLGATVDAGGGMATVKGTMVKIN